MNSEDIINTTVGELQVLKYLGTRHRIQKDRKRYIHLYKCLCSCGKEVNVNRLSLITHNTKSCGCIINKSRRKGLYSVYTSLYNSTKSLVRRRKKEFYLTREEYIEFVIEPCHYCKHPGRGKYNYKQTNLSINYNGLDRIDSSKHYTKDNIVTCCYICNRAKMDLPYNEFIEYLKEISNNVCK